MKADPIPAERRIGDSLKSMALLRTLSLCGAVFAVVVILAGTWTRLLDAGLGCPDWPGCYGALVVPDAEVAGRHASGVPLEASKAWMEMIHRYLAIALGGLGLVLVVIGWRLRQQPGFPWRLIVVLFTMLMVQGAFGAYTVTLKLWPQVVTLHLLGGISVLVLLIWLHLRLRRFHQRRSLVSAPMGRLWWMAAGLLVMQLALGGWTSSNYAGVACQGFPTCNTQWWPETDWGEGFHLTQTVGPNYLHGQLHAEARSTIHLAHRLGAGVLALALIGLAFHHWRQAAMRPWLASLMVALVLQIALGIANVLLWLPLGLALLHTVGAVLLVFVFSLASWKLRHPISARVHSPATLGKRGEWLHA